MIQVHQFFVLNGEIALLLGHPGEMLHINMLFEFLVDPGLLAQQLNVVFNVVFYFFRIVHHRLFHHIPFGHKIEVQVAVQGTRFLLGFHGLVLIHFVGDHLVKFVVNQRGPPTQHGILFHRVANGPRSMRHFSILVTSTLVLGRRGGWK